MKNHIMVLSSYLAVEDYEGAREYCSEILDKLNVMNSYVETGNERQTGTASDCFCKKRIRSYYSQPF